MRTARGLLTLVLAAAVATTVLVLPVAATTLRVPSQYPTIQAGVDAAQAGDTVLVAPGTFTHVSQPPGADSCAVFMKSGITLRGSGRSQTIIDPQLLARGIYCRNVVNARIEALTVRRAFGQIYGAGILCEQSSSPAIRDVDVTLCEDGGIICLNSSPTISNCSVTDNISKQGGGLAIENSASPQVTDCSILRNSAPAGGGIFVRAASAPTLTRCLIKDNTLSTVNGAGGGVGIVSATMTISDSQIENNTATGPGGGFAVIDNATLNATRCDIKSNQTTDDYGPGGGIYCEFASMTLDRCLIVRNTAPGAASDGGGIIAFFGADVTIRGCTIAANGTSAQTLGGGITCITSSPTIESSIIAFNNPGRGLYCTDGSSVPVVSCSDLFGNQGGNQICGTDGGDNFSLDPRFCNLAQNDFALHVDSPCLDNQHPTGAPCGQIGARALGTCDGIGIADGDPAPPGFLLRHQAVPNPFSTTTAITFELAHAERLSISIFDVDGRLVRLIAEDTFIAGEHALRWDGRDAGGRAVASGVYYYRLAGETLKGQTGRVVLTR